MAISSRLGSFVALAATLPLFVRGAPPSGPSAASELDYTLTLAPKRIAPDGFERISAVINGQMPGPLIRAKKGDTIHVNVINDMNNDDLWHSSSIHWHGLHMMNRNYDDGAATVTQCPIAPNKAYEYTLPTRNQYGTFWYHSHFSTQYCDGIRGPLVVYNPNDPHKALYDIDDETTIISLTEWYSTPAREVFHESDGHFPLPPIADSTLINGLGIKHRSGGKSGQLGIINVAPNKRYRMRLINMGCEPDYKFSIEKHTLTIIEADSILVKPMDVDGLTILVGQRYSFVLNTNQPPGNYWIFADPHAIGTEEGFADNINAGVLHYTTAKGTMPPKSAAESAFNFTKPLLESALQPLVPTKVPGVPEIGKADISITLSVDVDANFPGGPNPNGTNTWWFRDGNTNRTYLPPPALPVLLQILSGARQTQDFTPRDAVYSLPPNKVIELIFPPHPFFGPHPFHLHGHDFYVVQSADGDGPKWTNAIMRDTVSGGDSTDPNKKAVIRFVTDNPGPWFMHCHIDWHLDAGLGVVFAEDPQSAATVPEKRPTKEWDTVCKDYTSYLDNGGIA